MKTQNKAIAKDAALTGLPPLDKNNEPTKAQRDRWQREYKAQQDGALKIVKALAQPEQQNHKPRLEYLREQLRAQCISYGELAELQSLAKYIDPSDVELLEAAGVPETQHNWHLDAEGVEVAKGQGEGVSERDTATRPQHPVWEKSFYAMRDQRDQYKAHAKGLADVTNRMAAWISATDGRGDHQPLVVEAREALAAWEGAK